MKKIILNLFLYFLTISVSEAQWILQNSGTNQNLYDIEFINEKTGWAVGDAGVVIKTTNGGTNWLYVPNPSPLISPNLWSVCPIDENIVYVTSSGDFIMKTTNGGLNWDVILNCPSCNSSIKGVYFLNKDTGWFLGAYKVFRTYNGGITLDSFYVPWFTNFDIYFKDINTGILCGTGKVFKSTNRGESWFDTKVVPTGFFPMFRKLGVFENNIWVGAGNPNIYKSTNFGESWFISDSSIGAFGIFFINENTGYIGGGLNILYKTTNGGNNFIRERTDTNSLAFISSIDFVNDSVGWYSCAVGRIYKTTTGGEILTRIEENKTEIISSFYLYQNFPNPFNNSTNIEFNVVSPGVYRLEIYNLLGQKLEEIFNKNISDGRYQINYNADHLTSGVYIYKLYSEKYSSIRKFVLIK